MCWVFLLGRTYPLNCAHATNTGGADKIRNNHLGVYWQPYILPPLECCFNPYMSAQIMKFSQLRECAIVFLW